MRTILVHNVTWVLGGTFSSTPRAMSLSRSSFTFFSRCVGTGKGVWHTYGLTSGSTHSSSSSPCISGGRGACDESWGLVVFQEYVLQFLYWTGLYIRYHWNLWGFCPHWASTRGDVAWGVNRRGFRVRAQYNPQPLPLVPLGGCLNSGCFGVIELRSCPGGTAMGNDYEIDTRLVRASLLMKVSLSPSTKYSRSVIDATELSLLLVKILTGSRIRPTMVSFFLSVANRLRFRLNRLQVTLLDP